MPRRRSAPPDSLELLLDTICNMFGGVLFLSILIAVMIRTTKHGEEERDSKPIKEAVSADALHDLERELASLRQERDAKMAATHLQRELMRQFVDPDAAKLIETITGLEREQKRLESLGGEAAHTLATLRAGIETMTADLISLDEMLASSEKELVETRRKLAKEVESRTQEASLPNVRQSIKEEVGLILRFGRLYSWHQYDRFGRRIGVNLEDMTVIVEDDEIVEVMPKPFAGVPIPESGQDTRGVELKLKLFHPNENYIAIIVYDDSFEHFATLKRILIDLNFEYRLMPTTPGIEIRDHGGEGGVVQ